MNFGKITPQHVADLSILLEKNEISNSIAKQIIGVAFKTGESVEFIIESQGLKQINDTDIIESMIDSTLISNPTQVEEYRAGKEKVMDYLVGQIMKESKGKVNPKIIREMVKKKLKENNKEVNEQ